MEALKVNGKISEEGKLIVNETLPIPAGDVEIIILRPPTKFFQRHQTVQSLSELPACGIWKDRSDISDSREYALKLRRQIEERQDGTKGFN
ncbi:hypothetical protein H8E77_11825 [bacterium]|nr:hypothetical protein [bacterium]